MAILYKIDVLQALKDKGYSTYKLRQQHILSENTIQNFREGKIVSPENLDKLCELLNCQPSDLIEFKKE